MEGWMKKLLFGLAALPFLAGIASAAEPLSDAQLDGVTAGAFPPAGFVCPGCTEPTSSGSSSTTTVPGGAASTSSATGTNCGTCTAPPQPVPTTGGISALLTVLLATLESNNFKVPQ
jgi:hypothetical protein